MNAFAIRLYGKRWLKVTKPHAGSTTPIGWRDVTWTDDVADAEKWPSHGAAGDFVARRLPKDARFEIVGVPAPARPPRGGTALSAIRSYFENQAGPPAPA